MLNAIGSGHCFFNIKAKISLIFGLPLRDKVLSSAFAVAPNVGLAVWIAGQDAYLRPLWDLMQHLSEAKQRQRAIKATRIHEVGWRVGVRGQLWTRHGAGYLLALLSFKKCLSLVKPFTDNLD